MDDGHIAPIIDEELEKGLFLCSKLTDTVYVCTCMHVFYVLEYATRLAYRPQVSPTDVAESSPPTGSTRTSVKQQRQQSPYSNEQKQKQQQPCFYPSSPPPLSLTSSPHHRHLASTSTPSPSSPNSLLSISRPPVIMTKNMPPPLPHPSPHHHQQRYHPYHPYECNTFVQQQYSLPTATTNEQWYYPPSSVGSENFPIYHNLHHHLS